MERDDCDSILTPAWSAAASESAHQFIDHGRGKAGEYQDHDSDESNEAASNNDQDVHILSSTGLYGRTILAIYYLSDLPAK